jgi:transglutaminase-like putative cysteine protease
MSRAVLLPLLVVIFGFGWVGPSPALAGLLTLFALVPHIVRKRIVARPFIHIVTPLLSFLGGLATLAVLFGEDDGGGDHIRSLWAAFAGASLLAAAVRHYFAKPLGGDVTTLAVTVLALASLGDVNDSQQYLGLVIVFLLTAFLARRYADRGHAPLRHLGWRYLLPSLLALGTAAGVSVWLNAAIPNAHSWVLSHIGYGKAHTGFSQRMWLGSMRGMLSSNEIVMRLHGLPSDYLRGVVYTRYAAGRWSEGRDKRERIAQLPPQLAVPQDTTFVEYLQSNPKRYFLPRDIEALAITSGSVRVNRWGVISRTPFRPAGRVQFRAGLGDVVPLAAPDPQDTAVPPELLLTIQPIAAEWTRDADTVRDKLLAIERRLQRQFSYSLEFDDEFTVDPIVTFLLRKRRGHCEYFASAMALLSRSIGIPARVVGGYRVWERNTLAGHYVVRERHAHAWVEAWTKDDGWDHFDPTPPSDLARANAGETPWLAAVVDLGGSLGRRLSRWIEQRTITEFLAPPLVLLVLAFIISWVRRLQQRRKPSPTQTTDEPLPCLAELSAALSKHGLRRRQSQPIESLIVRVAQSALPNDLTLATCRVLENYVAFRFGDHGDFEKMSAEMKRLRDQLMALLRRSTRLDAPPPSARAN